MTLPRKVPWLSVVVPTKIEGPLSLADQFYDHYINFIVYIPITLSPGKIPKTKAGKFVLLLSCRARWLMLPDVPQPVRLIVLTLL
jgi:hypothetical protein